MMKYQTPKLKTEDIALYESFNKQYLSFFKEPPKGNPRLAIQTCDSHLELKQNLLFVDPKGNPANEITWSEPRDQYAFMAPKLRWAWLGIFVSSSIFLLIMYYFWGKW